MVCGLVYIPITNLNVGGGEGGGAEGPPPIFCIATT